MTNKERLWELTNRQLAYFMSIENRRLYNRNNQSSTVTLTKFLENEYNEKDKIWEFINYVK